MLISFYHGTRKRLFNGNPPRKPSLPVLPSWWNWLTVRVDTAATAPHTCTLKPGTCPGGAGVTQLRVTKIGTTCTSRRGTGVGAHRSPLPNVRGGIEMCPGVRPYSCCVRVTRCHMYEFIKILKYFFWPIGVGYLGNDRSDHVGESCFNLSTVSARTCCLSYVCQWGFSDTFSFSKCMLLLNSTWVLAILSGG